MHQDDFVACLEDISVFLKSPVDHLIQIRRVLRLLYENGFSLKVKPRKFFTDSKEYMLHLRNAIRPVRLYLKQHIAVAVATLEHASTLIELRFILELFDEFKRVISKFALLPPTFLKEVKERPTERSKPLDNKKNFTASLLDEALARSPVLALPNSDGQYRLDVDACA